MVSCTQFLMLQLQDSQNEIWHLQSLTCVFSQNLVKDSEDINQMLGFWSKMLLKIILCFTILQSDQSYLMKTKFSYSVATFLHALIFR